MMLGHNYSPLAEIMAASRQKYCCRDSRMSRPLQFTRPVTRFKLKETCADWSESSHAFLCVVRVTNDVGRWYSVESRLLPISYHSSPCTACHWRIGQCQFGAFFGKLHTSTLGHTDSPVCGAEPSYDQTGASTLLLSTIHYFPTIWGLPRPLMSAGAPLSQVDGLPPRP
ncbi:uncharacterized protein BCR38DRAFT_42561 [Pseudomassariella vexata]|uniref:Uncharacterized protein n=1 Tax=Pseudomassariella vexata TaxID=1141098 RepID=A0A1Y2DN53_9PEZI|nr:uncharacterized protein BCR38DRAFT_42561 [Pseudomassariella vexata]ORY60599.1 hypothetical protein BCR38DRAFT_42561 [Pseudomassariella vexata]